ncbi:LPS-assembly protein [Candidatus Kinetoplastibacterium desouzaii TCC079E]|uniref:LPS-assembly protein LptD n=1 Tax=Candidatus Kinetoplastidibacterium desouzai TCC079E TaxID=1208919 RepID=M1LTM7_9PROT|nr:LPS assembly protein LptD [Candidatus Kinetoplastibacterium desouzaii]AGF46664.1 LPS-assembly protein [Candidatus Kinetoplastibacterium desouzaii TCC079E]
MFNFQNLIKLILILFLFLAKESLAILQNDISFHNHSLNHQHIDLSNIIYLNKFNPQQKEATSIFEADYINIDKENILLNSNAKISNSDALLKGNLIKYNRKKGDIFIDGQSVFKSRDNIIYGKNLQYNIYNYIGNVKEAKCFIGNNLSYAEADNIDILSNSKIRLSKFTYTGCLCSNKSWYIKANSLLLDFDKNEGKAKNSYLYFYGIPIMIFPYLTFPVKNKSKSGFLIPTCGISSTNGLDIGLPYYINIANNYDMTITPRILSSVGVLFENEFRYLQRDMSGYLISSYLYNNSDHNRWFYKWENQLFITKNISLDINISRVSDNSYFRDFTSILSQNEAIYLPEMCKLMWFNSELRGFIQYYKYRVLSNKDSNISLFFDRSPEFVFEGSLYKSNYFNVGVYSNFVNLISKKKDFNSLNSAKRLQLYPFISCQINHPAYYIKSKLGLHTSRYIVNYHGSSRHNILSRTIPLYSLDSKVCFNKDITLFGNKDIRQLIEPRLFYLYVPYKYQDDIPCLDTSLSSLCINQLFDENLYNGGWDRIANANHIAFSLSTSFIDKFVGVEKFSISAAKKFIFNTRKVYLFNEKVDLKRDSDFLLSIKSSLNNYIFFEGTTNYNYCDNKCSNLLMSLRYSPEEFNNLYISYKHQIEYSNESVRNSELNNDNITIALQLPLYNSFYGIGRLDCSVLYKKDINSNLSACHPKIVQSILGFEYKKDNCWIGRIIFRRHSISSTRENNALFFQIEFNGLGSLGIDPIGFLTKSIPGYNPVMMRPLENHEMCL